MQTQPNTCCRCRDDSEVVFHAELDELPGRACSPFTTAKKQLDNQTWQNFGKQRKHNQILHAPTSMNFPGSPLALLPGSAHLTQTNPRIWRCSLEAGMKGGPELPPTAWMTWAYLCSNTLADGIMRPMPSYWRCPCGWEMWQIQLGRPQAVGGGRSGILYDHTGRVIAWECCFAEQRYDRLYSTIVWLALTKVART